MSSVALYAEPRYAPLPNGPAHRVDWPTVAATLSERPGEWAAIGTSMRSGHPLNGKQRRQLSLECQVRSNGDGTCTVWARYVGRPTEECRVRRPVPPPLVWLPPTALAPLRFAF